jgi:hypothetical protein
MFEVQFYLKFMIVSNNFKIWICKFEMLKVYRLELQKLKRFGGWIFLKSSKLLSLEISKSLILHIMRTTTD